MRIKFSVFFVGFALYFSFFPSLCIQAANPSAHKPPIPAAVAAQGAHPDAWRAGDTHSHTWEPQKFNLDGLDPMRIIAGLGPSIDVAPFDYDWSVSAMDQMFRTYAACGFAWAAITEHSYMDIDDTRIGVNRTDFGREYDWIQGTWNAAFNGVFIGIPGVEMTTLEYDGDGLLDCQYPFPPSYPLDDPDYLYCDLISGRTHSNLLFKSWNWVDNFTAVDLALEKTWDDGGFPIIAHPGHHDMGNGTGEYDENDLDLHSDAHIAWTMRGKAFGVEAQNGRTQDAKDDEHHRRWVSFLRRGCRAFPISASDLHLDLHPLSELGRVATVVYSDELTLPGIVNALRAGCLYASSGGPGIALWVRKPDADCWFGNPGEVGRWQWMGSDGLDLRPRRGGPLETLVSYNVPGGKYRVTLYRGRTEAGIDEPIFTSAEITGPASGVLTWTVPHNYDDGYLRAEVVQTDVGQGNRAFSAPCWFAIDRRIPARICNLRATALDDTHVRLAWSVESGGILPDSFRVLHSTTAISPPTSDYGFDDEGWRQACTVSADRRSVDLAVADPTAVNRYVVNGYVAWDGHPGQGWNGCYSDPAVFPPTRLDKPQNVSVHAQSTSVLKVDFFPPGNQSVSGFQLTCVPASGLVAWLPVEKGPEARSHLFGNLDCNQVSYRVSVRVFLDTGDPARGRIFSDWVSVSASTGWCKPRDLQVTAAYPNVIHLRWTDRILPKSAYVIERFRAGSAAPEAVRTTPTATGVNLQYDVAFIDAALQCGTRYLYRVRRAGAGEAEFTAPTHAWTRPALVTGLQVTNAGFGWVRLEWDYPACGTPNGRFRLEKAPVGSQSWEFATYMPFSGPGEFSTLLGVPVCSRLKFRVRAEIYADSAYLEGAWTGSGDHQALCLPHP
ncbi:MAG: fibronectin type III domain-containing protein [Acidobacteria bacterium]|nr:fibronectin type III domain-containing protein [Acidobacteriota bacterium]